MLFKINSFLFVLGFSVMQAGAGTEQALIEEQSEASKKASALRVQLDEFDNETVEGYKPVACKTKSALEKLKTKKEALEQKRDEWIDRHIQSLTQKAQPYLDKAKALDGVEKQRALSFVEAVLGYYTLQASLNKRSLLNGITYEELHNQRRWLSIIEDEEGTSNSNYIPADIFPMLSEFQKEELEFVKKKKKFSSANDALKEKEKNIEAEDDDYLSARDLARSVMIKEIVMYQKKAEQRS